MDMWRIFLTVTLTNRRAKRETLFFARFVRYRKCRGIRCESI